MPKVTVEFTGLDRLGRIFDRGSDAHRKVLGRAMLAQGEIILNASKAIVPYDRGPLRDSAAIEGPKVDSDGVEIELSYGGAAQAYAAVQHWDTTLNHPNGKQALYLKKPIDAQKETFVRSVMGRYANYLKRGM
jgi:hypothetical protein